MCIIGIVVVFYMISFKVDSDVEACIQPCAVIEVLLTMILKRNSISSVSSILKFYFNFQGNPKK